MDFDCNSQKPAPPAVLPGFLGVTTQEELVDPSWGTTGAQRALTSSLTLRWTLDLGSINCFMEPSSERRRWRNALPSPHAMAVAYNTSGLALLQSIRKVHWLFQCMKTFADSNTSGYTLKQWSPTLGHPDVLGRQFPKAVTTSWAGMGFLGVTAQGHLLT